MYMYLEFITIAEYSRIHETSLEIKWHQIRNNELWFLDYHSQMIHHNSSRSGSHSLSICLSRKLPGNLGIFVFWFRVLIVCVCVQMCMMRLAGRRRWGRTLLEYVVILMRSVAEVDDVVGGVELVVRSSYHGACVFMNGRRMKKMSRGGRRR